MGEPSSTDLRDHENKMRGGSMMLLEGVTALKAGRRFHSPDMPADWLPPRGNERGTSADKRRPKARKVQHRPPLGLTREQHFCDLLADGKSLDEIASLMDFTCRRVANAYLQRIRRKLGPQAV